MTNITKTLFCQGVRCPKMLYFSVKHKDKAAPDSLGVEFRKNQGNAVGELAKQMYPSGLDLAKYSDSVKLEMTAKNKDKILFEAAVSFEGTFARADILVPIKDGLYDIIEVKSDTEVKDEHIPDVSFQKRVFEKCGYKIHQVFIMHADNSYVFDGSIDVFKYFKTDDVTSRLIHVDEHIIEIQKVLTGDLPIVKIGPQCSKPYECSFKKECWNHLPKNNVTQLYYDKKIGFTLLDSGVVEIKDIGEIELKGRGARQRGIQIEATKNGEAFVHSEEIKNFVNSLTYPIYYFDFETYAPAIPVFDNSRPWQRIPFQYSLHIEGKDSSIKHKEFLGTEGDPRSALIKQMISDLGTKGSILVYNQTFEKSVIKELIRDFPAYAEPLNALLPRVVDLAHPFEQFHYYHPDQQGRYSIKIVLPLFSGLSYKDLDVHNGEEAFCAYEKIINNDPERENLIQGLLEYCKLDTLAEIEIVKKLREM
jgi:hypothetical protein